MTNKGKAAGVDLQAVLEVALAERAEKDRIAREKISKLEEGMWLQGEEEGQVYLVCERPGCVIPPLAGVYSWYMEVIDGYHPTIKDIQRAWDNHLVKHKEK